MYFTGDSAGGNLAAAVSLRLANESNVPKLKLQMLIYPALQAFDFASPSYILYGTGNNYVMLSKMEMVGFWLSYYQGNHDNMDVFLANNHTTLTLKTSRYSKYVSHNLISEDYKHPNGYYKLNNGENVDVAKRFEEVLLNPYYCPLMASGLKGQPPTYILTAEVDVLRDDGVMYAGRLRDAGVKVHHAHFERGFHGIFSMEALPIYKSVAADVYKYLDDNL